MSMEAKTTDPQTASELDYRLQSLNTLIHTAHAYGKTKIADYLFEKSVNLLEGKITKVVPESVK